MDVLYWNRYEKGFIQSFLLSSIVRGLKEEDNSGNFREPFPFGGVFLAYGACFGAINKFELNVLVIF
jgi:hypothetical protein